MNCRTLTVSLPEDRTLKPQIMLFENEHFEVWTNGNSFYLPPEAAINTVRVEVVRKDTQYPNVWLYTIYVCIGEVCIEGFIGYVGDIDFAYYESHVEVMRNNDLLSCNVGTRHYDTTRKTYLGDYPNKSLYIFLKEKRWQKTN